MQIKSLFSKSKPIVGAKPGTPVPGVSGYSGGVSGYHYSSAYFDSTGGVNASLQEPYDWFMKVFCDCGEIEWVTVEAIPGFKLVNGEHEVQHKKLLVCKKCGVVVVTENYKIVKKVGQIKPEGIDALKLVEDLREDFKNGRDMDAPEDK